VSLRSGWGFSTEKPARPENPLSVESDLHIKKLLAKLRSKSGRAWGRSEKTFTELWVEE